MIQERSIRVRAKIVLIKRQGVTKTRPTGRPVNTSNLDRQIQLEEAIEQRRALTNRTFRLCNDGLRDTPFTKDMATDGRRHVLTRIQKTDSAVQSVCHVARPWRGRVLCRGRHACLARTRHCHVKRFKGRRGRQPKGRAAGRGGTRTGGYQYRSVFSDIVGYPIGRNKHDRITG